MPQAHLIQNKRGPYIHDMNKFGSLLLQQTWGAPLLPASWLAAACAWCLSATISHTPLDPGSIALGTCHPQTDPVKEDLACTPTL